MRLHRFYTTEKITVGKELGINSDELANQVQNVFRLKVGDKIVIFNGTGFDYECKIDRFDKKNKINSNSVIRLSILSSKRNNFSQVRKLFLGAAIIKKDNFEWIVEKATELGVTDIIPIVADRSEKKALNGERLKKIATEASEQSGRDTTPMVHAIMGLGSAVSLLKKENSNVKILAFHTCIGSTYTEPTFSTENGHTDEENNFFRMHRLNLDRKVTLAVFIGPEGGWSPEEIAMFHRENVTVVCLGPQILRTETAVVAALSMVVFE